MIVLGIDPGATTGWCAYDSVERRAIVGGEFPEHYSDFRAFTGHVDVVVIERPKGQGPTRPELIECAITFGRLVQWACGKWPNVYELLRYDIKSILGRATLGEVTVRTDATAWAALRLIHGEGCDAKARMRKGVQVSPPGVIGAIAGSHQRAALAVAVAWVMRCEGF